MLSLPQTLFSPGSVGLLLLGAVFLLLLVQPLSSRPALAGLIGLPFAVLAGAVGLTTSSGQGLGLATAGLCGVAAVALLLLPNLEAEVPAHVAEASALLLLGT